MQPPESLMFSVPHCPPFHSWNKRDFWDCGKNSMPTELTLRWDAHHSFLLPQGPAANVSNEEEVGIWSEQQNKHMIWTVSLPYTSSWSEKFYLSKGKNKIHLRDHLGNSLSPSCFAPQLLTCPHQLPIPPTRRWKTLSIKCLCTRWGQILLQWSHHIFWTQTLQWCQGKEPQARGSQG